MNVPTVEMPREKAQKAFNAYRRLVRERLREEDRAIMDGYRELAQGRAIIDLVAAFRETGVNEAGRPRLAVCQAGREWCYYRANSGARNGVLFTHNTNLLWDRRVTDRSIISVPIEALPGIKDGYGLRAMVPIVPPQFRPARKLEDFHILWEAEWQKIPPPPRDPMLLKRLRGTLYAVVAVWDLTPLEQLILGAVRTG